MAAPRVSVIIPVHNQVELTATCLQALARNTVGCDYEVIIVDDGSTDATPQLLATVEGDVQTLRNETNIGFARSCNKGAALARGEYLVFLNNDTLPLPGWLDPLLRDVDADARVGAVGSKLLFEDGSVQHAGVVFSRDGLPHHIYYRFPANFPGVNKKRRFNAVTAACMLVRRSIFEKLGGFDESFINGYEDVDFCLRLRAAGYEILYEPESVLYHFEKQTRGENEERTRYNAKRLYEKWGPKLPRDDGYYYQEDLLGFYVPLVLREEPLVKVSHLVCPGCGRKGGSFVDGFGEYDRYRCEYCDLVFSHPMRAKDYNAAYESDDNYRCRENENWWQHRYLRLTQDSYFLEGYFQIVRSYLERIRAELPSGRRRLLDIGFGDGVFLRMAQEMGFTVAGYEVSRKALEIARRFVPGVLVAGDYAELAGPFEVVTMFDVLEHVEDPVGLIYRAVSLLVPGGYLIVGVPNWNNFVRWVLGFDVISNYPPNHLTMWSEKALRHLLAKFSFKKCELSYSYPGPETIRHLFQSLHPQFLRVGADEVKKEALLEILTNDGPLGSMMRRLLEYIPRHYGATLLALCQK